MYLQFSADGRRMAVTEEQDDVWLVLGCAWSLVTFRPTSNSMDRKMRFT
jgi:hypothetical protein